MIENLIGIVSLILLIVIFISNFLHKRKQDQLCDKLCEEAKKDLTNDPQVLTLEPGSEEEI